ncbi:hypothetical protein DICVIV_03532 [Dictyocaulus viviparus]|uniref:Uncharacterized protein n=1 Tax=Dictyocaulus viviparus TaxID=29172 RepID=A0A0D8Y0F1_DICVI|nr:hypothetical protein DICVIV_03532 [Dictyocaulus viviparus]
MILLIYSYVSSSQPAVLASQDEHIRKLPITISCEPSAFSGQSLTEISSPEPRQIVILYVLTGNYFHSTANLRDEEDLLDYIEASSVRSVLPVVQFNRVDRKKIQSFME